MGMRVWDALASKQSIQRAIAALQANGIEASLAESGEEAKDKVAALLAPGAEVLTMTSITLDQLGLVSEINDSGKYKALRPVLMGMDQKTQAGEMRKLGAAPDFAVGSVHAITEDGSVLIASLTGSQLPAYAYAAGTVIWVAGAQKIVKNAEEGMRRIYEYLIPRESVRARKAYGLPDSFSSFPAKILVINREVQPGRLKLVIVNEVLGH